MAVIHSDEFKRDAVRIATTSGLTRRQVASDLGLGLSTLNKWVKMVSDQTGSPDPDRNLLRENERLRRENRILKEERELQKRPRSSSRPKSREVRVSGRLSWIPFTGTCLPRDGCHGSRSSGLEAPSCIPSAAARYGALGAYPRSAQIEPGQLWPPPNDGRAERVGLACRAPPGRPSDAAERNLRGQNP